MSQLMFDSIGTILTQLTNAALTAYIARTFSREFFTYLNHRLDVLGKDAFIFPPADRYTATTNGRMSARRKGSDTASSLSITE